MFLILVYGMMGFTLTSSYLRVQFSPNIHPITPLAIPPIMYGPRHELAWHNYVGPR